jgi:hypothetical protein
MEKFKDFVVENDFSEKRNCFFSVKKSKLEVENF